MIDNMATEDSLHSEIAKILRHSKQQTGISFSDLAERSGFAQSAIVNWLNGLRSPQVESFYYLCKALDLDAPDVLREAIANIERHEQLSKALTAAVQQALQTDKRTFIVELPGGAVEHVTVEIHPTEAGELEATASVDGDDDFVFEDVRPPRTPRARRTADPVTGEQSAAKAS